MSGLLAGRVAVVTGGARGLGAAIASRFRTEGAGLVTLDLEDADEACDIADEAQVRAAFARIAERHGRVDILVANAGLVPRWRELGALDMAEWDRVFAVNVRGVALSLKHAVPLMPRGGAVVAMGSIMSEKGAPGQALYTATKHAVLGIVRAAAQELGPRGIRVNALGPGPIATAALRGRVASRAEAGIGPAPEVAFAALDAETPLGRIATEAEVAQAALFLASDLSSGISGRLLRVDGGLA
ncbi:SDR family NAD(P)-dependent oxidoreductase [Falsiroseomonas ponticola]|uniref:SDR family NAD(P)-dependent oxidoreductase n=1 Tax=Falsiroseomonas ponticola TaxID=2786951 RepID=UPI001931276B|nr:SDR family oxidoreductase [Roseomonas ponticola]